MVCWSVLMLALIFTSDTNALLEHGDFNLNSTAHPQFAFFEIYQFRVDMVVRKMGHMFMFAMWLLFIFIGIKSLKHAVWITLALSLFTEIIQPYFSRDGRLLDVIFDSTGVLLMAFFIHIFLVATTYSREDKRE